MLETRKNLEKQRKIKESQNRMLSDVSVSSDPPTDIKIYLA